MDQTHPSTIQYVMHTFIRLDPFEIARKVYHNKNMYSFQSYEKTYTTSNKQRYEIQIL
jgi:hypothetical protein